MRILFISDLHLGGGDRADDFGRRDAVFCDWLDRQNVDHIIVVGDMYELWQASMRKIKKAHHVVIDKLKDSVHIIGNHDDKIAGKKRWTLTLPSGKKVLATHGHQSDERMNSKLIRTINRLLSIIERIPGFGWVDNPELYTKYRSRAQQKTRQLAASEFSKYDIVICGHTHRKEIEHIGSKIYANTGTCQHGNFEGIILDIKTGEIKEIMKWLVL